jgi:putative glutamine amidotransferase
LNARGAERAGRAEGGSSGRVVVSVGAVERAAAYLAALRAVGLEQVTVLAPEAGPHGGSAGEPAARAAATLSGAAEPAAGTAAALAGAAEPAARAAAALAGAAGLVLCGGSDVDPRRYGEAVRPGAGVEAVPERDALEWELIAAARAARLPVWGICRGLQVLNVFFGGTLWQDLPSQRPPVQLHQPLEPVHHKSGAPPDALAHGLRVTAPHTAFGELLARDPTVVNSRHHQGIRDLAPALIAVAVAPDGLVEAVEAVEAVAAVELADGASGGWWLRAVQWHPENLVAMAPQRALWQDFALAVAAAARASLALAG